MRLVLAAVVVGVLGCGRAAAPRSADIAVVGESTRTKLEAVTPATTPWFDGKRVTLVAARGETLGIQVLHTKASSSLTLDDPAVTVRAFAVESFAVSRPSTAMYGGSQGKGRYADALTPAGSPTTNPAYFELMVGSAASPGERTGELAVGDRRFPVSLTIVNVTLPPLSSSIWAYEDPRELAWAARSSAAMPEPKDGRPPISRAEQACIDLFRAHGVLLSPDLSLEDWPERRGLLTGAKNIPVVITDDPAEVGAEVKGWIEATRGTGQVPFAIPIDEPQDAEARQRVRALAAAVRAAGGGPTTFRYAVTDEVRPEYGDLVDLYISLRGARLGDRHERWTYNGAPPYAGSMVLDAATPGARTWGWIAWRWNIATWYVWDALYWHDRHNARKAKIDPPQLDPRRDPVSFDDGDDHGNFDGVLALPTTEGCQPTLRLAAIRRGLQDRQLLELASRCAPDETKQLAAKLIPTALGDAPKTGAPSWPTDEAAWELARRELLALASCAR
ncbi:MAG: hypothetical protein AB7P03_20980 [Kofleriaceae bacterium]